MPQITYCHKICHTCHQNLENVPQTVSKSIKSATKKCQHKHNATEYVLPHQTCHTCYQSSENLPQTVFKYLKSATYTENILKVTKRFKIL